MGRGSSISREGLIRPLQDEPPQPGGLLALPSEPVACLVSALPGGILRSIELGLLIIDAIIVAVIAVEDAGDEARGGVDEDGAVVGGGGEDPASIGAPGDDGTFGFCRLAEDKAEEHVETAKSEQEERGDKGEVVDMVGENLGGDPNERSRSESRDQHE